VKVKKVQRLSVRLLILNLFLAQFTFLSLNQAFAVNVTVTQNSNGTISPGGTVVVASGDSQVFTLTPNSGYAVQSVTVGGVALTGAALVAAIENRSHTVTNVTSNQAFTATFATVDPGPTLGPLFIGAGKLYTDLGYAGTLTSKQYSGAAVPDAANRIMYGEIGKSLWLGAMAATGSSTQNLGNFSINLSSNSSLNTAGCSIGSTTQAGTYVSKRIAYAAISATGPGSCVVYVSRSTYTNASNGYTSNDSLAWTINWATPCANITTETRNDITCYIGQLGPGGGIVFYDAGNAGYSSFQARYLQAPPSGWYGRDQPTNLTPLYSNNVFFGTASNRPASQGDPTFKICALANTNLAGSTSREGSSDVVLSGTAGNTGPGTSLSYIDQSTRFGSNIGSGPNNDKLYRNSMCAFTPFTPQYELANWKSPSDTQLGRWSVPSYADMIPMVQQSYVLDMDPSGGFFITSTPCFVDYRPGGNNQTCTNDAGISIMSSPTTFAQVQLQQRVSGTFSAGQLLGQVPSWNTAGSMNTSTWIQPGDSRYSISGFHGINYVTSVGLLRPVQSFPYFSTNAKLSTASGLSVVGSVTGTNYPISPTYNNTVTSYSASVVTSDSGVKIIPQLDDFRASVTVNGIASTDGQPTTVAITAGTTLAIDVVVTAVSGATNTYTISVTRPLAVQSSVVTVSNVSPRVPTGGVVATTLTASGGNGTGAYVFSTSSPNCSISGDQLTTTLSSGSCSVTAVRLGDSSYAASSSSAAVTFTVTTAGIVAQFDSPVSTSTGFTVNVTNFDATYTFNTTASSGVVTKGTAVGSNLPLTVTSLTNGASSTITVTTSKTNFTTQSSSVSGAALFTVTYDSQGGTTVTAGSFATGAPLSLPAGPTRTGYTFAGWFAAATGGTALSTGYSPSNASAFTLYAQWTGIDYQLTFDANNSTSGSAPSSLSYTTGGSALTLPGNSGTLARTGYTFAGWATAANGTGTSYTAAQSGVSLTTNTILYAKWTANSYSITFDAQSGSSQSSISFTTGNTVTMPAASTRAGYTFAGWNTAADGTGTNYTATQSGITFVISTILYAKWTANSFNATFNSQGGSAVSAVSFTTGSTLILPAEPTRAGYTFNGWFAAASGGSALVSGYSPINTSTFTLFAQWTGVGYQLTFNVNAATSGTVPASQSYTMGGTTLTLPGNPGTLARSGFIFTGWNTAVDGLGTSFTASQAAVTILANTILYAKWTSKTARTLSFNTMTFSKSYGETQTVTAALSLGTGAITYSRGSSSACTVNASTGLVTITNGVGTCEISASAVEDLTYQEVATTTSAIFTVSVSLPVTPTLGAITSVDGVLSLAFTQSDSAGNGITDYKYSIDGINYISVGNTNSPLSIPGLTPGTYTIRIIAVNSIGDSLPTAPVMVVVIAGPTVTITTPGGGGGGGGGGIVYVSSGPSVSEIANAQKAAVDKALADKAIADKLLADKAAVEKLIADKLVADKAAAEKLVMDKLVAEKTAAEKALADKLAADKAIADKLVADNSAAAAAFKSTCNLAQGSTAVTPKSLNMKIYLQVCFVPDLMKPLDSDLAQVKKIVQQLKSKKIMSVTLSSFADEKSGVNFKSVAQGRADVVASMIMKANPKMKITYRLFGSSTKKNSLSLGRVVITA